MKEIKASEQRLLDEAVGTREGHEEKYEKEKETKVDLIPRAGVRARIRPACRLQLEAVKAAAKPPFKGMHTLALLLRTGADGGFVKLFYWATMSLFARFLLPCYWF